MNKQKDEIIYKVGDDFYHLIRVDNGYEYTIYDGNYTHTDKGIYKKDEALSSLSDILDTSLLAKFGEKEFGNLDISEITDLEKFQERVTYFEDCDFPDFYVSITQRDDYGYTSDLMLPLQASKALELFDKDVSVYILYEDNIENQISQREDIDDNFFLLFGVKKSDWDLLKLQDHTKTTQKDPNDEAQASRNINFSKLTEDCYAIYQLKKNISCLTLYGDGLEYLNRINISVDHNNYDNVYVGILKPIAKGKSLTQILDNLFTEFNVNHPSDFSGASMSVSDVIGLKVDGKISFHYVDRIGFARQRLFNPLEIIEHS